MEEAFLIIIKTQEYRNGQWDAGKGASMRYLLFIASAIGIALAGCSTSTPDKTVSCFDTGSGIKCFSLTEQEAADLTDVDGDEAADSFVCADAPSDSDSDADGVEDSESAGDDAQEMNEIGIATASDADADSESDSDSNSDSDTDCGVSEPSSDSDSVSDLDGDGDGDGISDTTDCDCVLTEPIPVE